MAASDVCGADLRGVNLSGATGVRDLGHDSEWERWLLVLSFGPSQTMLRVGPRWLSIEQARQRWGASSSFREGDRRLTAERRARFAVVEALLS